MQGKARAAGWIEALNRHVADLKSEAERSMTAIFRVGIVISLIFIAIRLRLRPAQRVL
jgi:hypothetical protein